jgi:hypothetical protein
MDAFLDPVRQYPAQEQAELRVRVKVPGSWFSGLTTAERAAAYEAEGLKRSGHTNACLVSVPS